MEPRDTDIGMSDVVRAWSGLGARTPEERALIAALLGFDYTFPGKERRLAPRVAPEPAIVNATDTAATAQTDSRVADRAADLSPSMPIPLARLRSEAAPSNATPDWLRIDQPLQPELPEHLNARPAHRPLFNAGWTRAILSAACATASADGPIDIERLVAVLSTCRPIAELPRETVLSLSRGVDLLVDRGENLMPFARDIRDLQHQLQLVVGRDRTRIQYFDSCPIFGSGPGARSTWATRYEPPAPKTPIVAITDLGMARGSAARTRATEDSWLTFFRIARASECPVIVFAPYPVSRWPTRLAKAVHAMPWDRPTTVSLARQMARQEGIRE